MNAPKIIADSTSFMTGQWSTKIIADSTSFMAGKWSAKKYAREIVTNTKSKKCGVVRVASKPMPIKNIKIELQNK